MITSSPANEKSIKILSLDGGGIRGIIPAIILEELQKQLGKKLYQVFDLITGTSTGGIIALGIGTQCNNGTAYSPHDLANLYISNGSSIFKKNLLTPVKELFRPKYSPDSLEQILAKFFQGTEFASALTPLLISSYDLQSQRPFFFKSHKIAVDPAWNWPVATIARATSAAPTYFSPLHLVKRNEDYALVDGGIFVNNPAMAAYAEARSLYPNAKTFTIVSIGTGKRKNSIAYSTAKNWGLIDWAKEIESIFMDSASEAVDYEISNVPKCDYFRFQPVLPNADEATMDNVSPQNLANLQVVAKNYISSASINAMLNQLCEKLSEGRGSNMPGIGLKVSATLTTAGNVTDSCRSGLSS